MRSWLLALSALALSGPGCEATPPEVDAPGLEGFDAGGTFADTIIAFGDNENPTSCTDTLPDCGAVPATCGPLDVLGAPDATEYTLPANGRLEVAFRCSQITENGGSGDMVTPDFQILGTVPEGGRAVVEVSLDGTDYVTLQPLTQGDQTFDLSREAISVVRFVRISDSGGGGITIDAISAL